MANTRNHNLKVGEIVYDCAYQFFGVIVELTDNKAILDMNGKPTGNPTMPIGWCEMENKLMFDVDFEENECKWECDTLNDLYQIAWGIKDKRSENIVCYEHNIEEYPYFSPYLYENLYNFEVEEI